MLGTSTVDPSAAAKWVTSPPNSSTASTASQYTLQASAPHQLPGTSYPVAVQQQNSIVTHHQNFHPHYQNPTAFPNNYGNIPPAQSLKSPPVRNIETKPACLPSTSTACSSAEPQPSTSTADSSACSEGQMTSSSTVASFSSRRARFTFRLGAKAAQRLKRIANFQPQTLRRIGFASIRVGTDDSISVADAPSPPLPMKEEKMEPLEEIDNKSNRASSALGTVPPSPVAGPSPQLNQQQGTPASQSAPTPVPCQIGLGGPEMPQGMIPQGAMPLGVQPQGPPSIPNRPPGQVVNNNSPLLAGLLSNQQPPQGMQPNPGQPQMNPAAQRSFSPYQYPPQPGMVPHQQGQPMDPQQLQAMHEQRQRMMMHQQAMQQQMANQVGGPSPQGAHMQMQPGMPPHPQQVYYNPQQGGPQGPPRVPMNYPPGSMPPGAMPGQPLYHGQPQRMPMPPGYPGVPQGPPQGAMPPQYRPQEEAPPPKKKRKPTKKQQQKEAELAAAAAQSAQHQQQQQQQQQQMMVGHPQHMGAGGMMGYPAAGHGGYPHGPPQYPPGYPHGAPPQQQQMWHNQHQMQQRMMFQQQQHQQQQQQQAAAAAAAAAGQPGQWPQQRPPVPYPTGNPVMGMENGPASVHPPVSQRTSAEFSQDGTSPATPLQQPAGMSRTDSHPNMFGFNSSNPPSSNTDTTFDKIWSGDVDGDLGDLDDIEPMNELSCSSSLLTDGALVDNYCDNGMASTSSPEKSTPTPNGDRIDSSIASVVEMVSKSCSQSSQSGPTVSQPITVTASNANPLKRRHSNSQMVVNMENQNTAPQQQQQQHQDHRFVQNVPLPQSMPPSHLQQHHMQQLHAQNNTGPGRPKQNGDSRMVNGHEGPPVGKVPNGSRHPSTKMPNRGEPPQDTDQITQLVNSIMKEEKRKKAVEMELKAKNPRKGRRKADMQIKEETQNDDEIFDGRPRNTMAATANFNQVLARQTVMLQQQHIQPKQ